ncbi:pyridoxal phosphate-dependent aminotransferase [Cetobacterium sp. 2A]|uniref:pyridoxal phosphate-dependent aminotransferase n=1 Tax=Cetobacterium sp. 2A TaxID=2754723 RepID=UPI00163D1107|nr:pyridoxal phosphate-dependent aminotransferase [Cetobacterium sp. 2A]MBC2857310.1 pyridoxal phosphate-dependent aminotransferase [Cetobacterium sp. 2A]
MRLSQRVLDLKTSPVRKLVPYAEDAVKNGKKIYHLNIGQPDVETPQEFYDAINNFDEKTLKYSHSAGKKELIEEISKYYKKLNINYNPEDILITVGGSEAVLFTLLALFDEGDEILIPEPYYANYNSFFDLLRVKVVPIRTSGDNGFHLPSKEEIEKLVTTKTKAIMFSNPGNPTGTVYKEDELNILNEVSKENNLYIISDEVYREFTYGENKAISFGDFKDAEERVIIIDSISKRYSACGARIGCIISKNKEFMKSIYKLCQSRLSAPTLDMVGAEALYKLPVEYFDSVKNEYQKRRNTLFKELSTMEGVKASEPEGAFYTVVKLPVEDAEAFSIWLLKDFQINMETIMLTPAEGFYATPGLGKDEVRISYAIKDEELITCMKIMREGLIEYKKLKNK